MNSGGMLTYWVIGLVSLGAGFLANRLIEMRKMRNAKNEAEQLVENAKGDAGNIRRDAMLEAKENILKAKNEFDKEVRESKKDLSQTERRLQQRQSTLDKKFDQVDKRESQFQQREKELKRLMEKTTNTENQYQEMISQELRKLEALSSMTSQEAKEELKEKLIEETRNETALIMKKIEDNATLEANKKAQKIISLAIQRNAADYIAETTVSVVNLSGDEMKGRIIGREGRNIKALEMATGVDLIIDDTPEAVILSCYDPIKREVARLTLERLVVDGRIHPSRIEDVVNKVKKEVERNIQDEGQKVAMEVGCEGIHPEIIKLLGRLKYRTSYSQNVLMHSKEVAFLSGMMAAELGLDSRMARRAGLLHDIGKAATHEMEGTHTQIGGDIARRHNEKPIVIDAIISHHEDVEAEYVISTLVAAADAMSASRPGARSEMLEAYVKRLKKLEEIGNSFRGVDKTYAIQAGREIRVSVIPDSVTDGQAHLLAKDISKKIEAEMAYPGEIKVTVIREMRVTEFAR